VKNFFKAVRERNKVEQRRILPHLNIGETWRQKAFHAIPLSGLSAISQMELGSEQRNRWLSDVTVGGKARNGLRMNWAGSVSYRLYIPARAKFLSYIALMPDTRGRYHGRVAFRVEVLECGGDFKISRQKLIDPSRFNRDPKWIQFTLRLHRLANRQAQIILSAYAPDDTGPEHAPAVWGDPTVLFRISMANLIALGKKALEIHGVLGTVKKILSKAFPRVDNSLGAGRLPILRRQFTPGSFSLDSSPNTTAVDQYLAEIFARSSGSSPDYVPMMKEDAGITEPQVKLIAFYLPQFHPIPENDEWWGKGFTEWTNVARATPQFVGHYQPRLPGELGFYDLRVREVQRRQVELAKRYGIFGFCFHYYWFGGKCLLDLPLKQFLDTPDLDFPFCLCWANENWTRRWDGLDNEVLVAQAHSPEDDLAFIQSIEPALRDKRYIKVNGRPLLVVYRPSLLPNPRETAQRWRDYCARKKLGDLYLLAPQAFETVDPRPLGFDGALEFPPHKLAQGAPILNSEMEIVNPEYQGFICDYSYMVEAARKIDQAEFTLFRGVCPSWDNEARKPGRGLVYKNSTPALYQQWLTEACRFAAREAASDKRLVFINAWNEWGEGAYLEPDRRYGYAYLQATANALREFPKKQSDLEIVFVSHDAANAGAQRLLLTLIAWLRDKKGVRPKIVLRRGGPLVPEFYRLGPVFEMESSANWILDPGKDELVRFCKSASLIYVNTVVPGEVVKELSELNVPIVTHVHELEHAIKRWCVNEDLQQLLELTDHFIAASPPVAKNLESAHNVVPARVTTIYSFIECDKTDVHSLNKTAIRKEKQLPERGLILFGCGTTDWRKGPDLFIEVARQAEHMGLDGYYFFWIGGDTGELKKLETRVRNLGLKNRVRFLGEFHDARSYFAAGDVFLLTSREDPFPLVCLEAADAGLPIVCFDKAGGMPDFVENDAGYVVPFEDTKAMAEKVVYLCANPEERVRLGATARYKVRARHDISIAGEEIFRVIDPSVVKRDRQSFVQESSVSRDHALVLAPKVSVIVPNYNHAAYLRQRLDSIINQKFQDFEVIVLDDASTDRSREIIQTYVHHPRFRFSFNRTRSGSAFKQWKKGLEEARGEYVWFAESDDYSSPNFLSKLLPILETDKSIGIVYCQSYLVDPENRILGDALQWTEDLDPWRWRSDFVNDGKTEVKRYLSKKNTIPNASAVLIRATTLKSIDYLDDAYGLCGDWLLWIKLLLRSNVGYVAEKLNYWRQQSSNSRPHPPGVTEWKEGQQVLRYVAQELALSEAEKDKMLLDFLGRCFEWLKDDGNLLRNT
jgi:glycosyltransferase involved in cell wall biosynthesis